MQIKAFDKLPDDALEIRIEVFVNEQGFADGASRDDSVSKHFVAYDSERAVATARLCPSDKEGEYILGRIAVIKQLRGNGLGKEIVAFAEEYARQSGIRVIRIHAQYHAKDFYQKIGYTPFGEIDYEQGKPHQWFKKQL